jgi:DNA-binding response OmpR family regulator
MYKSILIVDDEPVSRDALARTLVSHGFQVRTAADSHQATRELAAEPAEVVLLDLDLPHVPGESLAAFLRLRYPKTRIIFMSGQYDMINPERFGEHSVYLRKPIDVPALLELLSEESSAV